MEGDSNMDPDVKLFLGDPDGTSVPFLTRIWTPIGLSALGLFASVINNAVLKKPVLSSMQRHVLYASVGFFGGAVLEKWRMQREGERDLMYYHYMTLHPEDFPAPERVKYRDYIEPWVPIR